MSVSMSPRHPEPGRAHLVATWLVIALIAAAAVFGGYNIARLTIDFDEAITLLELAGDAAPDWPHGLTTAGSIASAFDGHASLSGLGELLKATDVHPPLYYWTASLWGDIVGQTKTGLRSLSLACILLAAFLLSRIGAIFGPFAQVAAPIIFLVSPATIFAAINARGYGLALLLLVAMTACALRGIRPSDPDGGEADRGADFAIAAAGAFGGAAFLTHYFTLFATAPALGLMGIFALRRHPVAVIAAAILALLAAFVALPYLAVQIDARPNQYVGFRGLTAELLALFRAFVEQFTEIPQRYIWTFEAFCASGALLGLAALAGFAGGLSRPAHPASPCRAGLLCRLRHRHDLARRQVSQPRQRGAVHCLRVSLRCAPAGHRDPTGLEHGSGRRRNSRRSRSRYGRCAGRHSLARRRAAPGDALETGRDDRGRECGAWPGAPGSRDLHSSDHLARDGRALDPQRSSCDAGRGRADARRDLRGSGAWPRSGCGGDDRRPPIHWSGSGSGGRDRAPQGRRIQETGALRLGTRAIGVACPGHRLTAAP
ncbi:MAG: glycosyltransferase family 39 protein [Rhodobacteraceae bacterium]|nr:glycosyltransferase family 39 protein [Paracoccaceae bacterium]